MLLLVLGATMGLLLVQVLYDDFRTLRDYGAPAADIARYVVITIPSFLALVLPLALLISLLFVLGKLHRANEFTALRAAGVGTLRITVPVWIVGLGVCGLAAWLNTTVVPWSVEQSQAMHDALQFRKQSGTMSPDRIGAIYSVGFDNPAAGRMWFFNRYSEFTGRAYGVSVSQLDERRRELSRIDAAEAWFDVAKGWTFLRGRELFAPAQIWHSPLHRARETAERLAKRLELKCPVIESGGLLPEDDVRRLGVTLKESCESLALVGHEPHLSALASLLVTGVAEPPAFVVKKCAVIALDRVVSGWAVRWQISPELFR